jgi:hypothetical protein
MRLLHLVQEMSAVERAAKERNRSYASCFILRRIGIPWLNEFAACVRPATARPFVVLQMLNYGIDVGAFGAGSNSSRKRS